MRRIDQHFACHFVCSPPHGPGRGASKTASPGVSLRPARANDQ
jgi:hypothetical protein